MKKNILPVLGVQILLAFFLSACPGNGIVSQGSPLTITGLPSGFMEAYVFRQNTDLSTFLSAAAALQSRQFLAVGVNSSANAFSLYEWDGYSRRGTFTGAGNFPVLIVRPSSSDFWSATVLFIGGGGAEAFANFARLNPSPGKS